MALIDNLREMERTREAYWRRYPQSSPTKLRWRAITVRHWFHVLPTESVLEIGAGSGLWTEHLTDVLRGESPVTAAVFNPDLAQEARSRGLAATTVAEVADLARDLPENAFDYVVGTAILCHDRYGEHLRWLMRLLKPGGRLLFFEANFWNAQVLVKSVVPAIGRRAGNARCQVGMRRFRLMQVLSQQGFTEIEITPYDIVHPRTPKALIRSRPVDRLRPRARADRSARLAARCTSRRRSRATRRRAGRASTSPSTAAWRARPRWWCPAATRR